jgi:hypothetical protein
MPDCGLRLYPIDIWTGLPACIFAIKWCVYPDPVGAIHELPLRCFSPRAYASGKSARVEYDADDRIFVGQLPRARLECCAQRLARSPFLPPGRVGGRRGGS